METFNAVQCEIKKMQSVDGEVQNEEQLLNDEKRRDINFSQTFLCSSNSSTIHCKCTIKE